MVQFFTGCGLVEAAHGKEMVHFDAAGSDIGSDSTELGMVRVQGFEFVPQTVELASLSSG